MTNSITQNQIKAMQTVGENLSNLVAGAVKNGKDGKITAESAKLAGLGTNFIGLGKEDAIAAYNNNGQVPRSTSGNGKVSVFDPKNADAYKPYNDNEIAFATKYGKDGKITKESAKAAGLGTMYIGKTADEAAEAYDQSMAHHYIS